MAMEIERKIRQRGLTHQQAAEILGINEDQLSESIAHQTFCLLF